MGVSCAVIYDSATRALVCFREGQLNAFFRLLSQMDLVVGFNIRRFDYKVLSAYTTMDLWSLPTLDILDAVKGRLGYRLSLDALCSATLGTRKSADGLMALKWWKSGEIRKVLEYCKDDVRLTRDLFLFGHKNGYLLFRNKAKALVRLPVGWRQAYEIGG
jgi:DEAD/DEAH box helicase domain-containing protein